MASVGKIEEAAIPPHFGGKRYYSHNAQLRATHGAKVFKVAIDAGFTCPNRDGSAGIGGCTFCSLRGSGDFAGTRDQDLAGQFERVRARMHLKWRDAKYIAYFQAFTNTYAPVEVLRRHFETLLSLDGVVGLAVATRPDCLPNDVLDYLADLRTRTHLWVELGLQTIHAATARRINRGHDYACYLDGLQRLRERRIEVCVHIINGLPGETPDKMLETAAAIAGQEVQGIKIHLLHVLKRTPLALDFAAGSFETMPRDDYVDTVCSQLELLPPEVVVHRLTGDGPRETLLAPMWSLKKWEVLNAIDDELARRGSWQGKFLAGSASTAKGAKPSPGISTCGRR